MRRSARLLRNASRTVSPARGRRDFQQQPQLEDIHDVGRPGDHDPETAVAFELDHVSLDEPHERLAHWAPGDAQHGGDLIGRVQLLLLKRAAARRLADRSERLVGQGCGWQSQRLQRCRS
jgi:hypothetical protein